MNYSLALYLLKIQARFIFSQSAEILIAMRILFLTEFIWDEVLSRKWFKIDITVFFLQVENQGRVNYGPLLMDTEEVREIQFLWFFLKRLKYLYYLFYYTIGRSWFFSLWQKCNYFNVVKEYIRGVVPIPLLLN